MTTALFDSVVTEVFDFDNDGTAVKSSGHDLTGVNTPTYGSTSPPQGTHYADLDAATDEHFTLADGAGAGNDFDADASDYSFSFWLNSAVGDPQIASKGGIFDTDSWTILGEYRSGSSFDIAVKHRAGGNNFCRSGFDINANKNAWFHIIGAYDQTGGDITWWVSSLGGTFGDEINASAISMGASAAANTVDFFVGGRDATNTLDGKLDEFAFFKGTVLNATEAEEIYDGVGVGGWREEVGGATSKLVVLSRHRGR